jgi:hypothetical protein
MELENGGDLHRAPPAMVTSRSPLSSAARSLLVLLHFN